jgi:hypothetical protein
MGDAIAKQRRRARMGLVRYIGNPDLNSIITGSIHVYVMEDGRVQELLTPGETASAVEWSVEICGRF